MSNGDPIPPVNQPPPPTPQPSPKPSAPTFIDSLIPAKNTDALLSYYVGLFSIIPCAGLVMGPVAFFAGRRALKAVKATPGLPGSTHAKVGIGCGSLGFLFNAAIVLFVLAVMLFGHNKT